MPSSKKSFVNRRRRRVRRRPRRTGLYLSRIRSPYRQNVIHSFKRTFLLENFGVNDALFSKAYNFRLNQLPNYTEFTTLFDAYRIVGIKVNILFSRINVNSGPGAQTAIPQGIVYDVVDYDGDTALTIPEIYQYQNLHIIGIQKLEMYTGKITRFFRPKVSVNAYAGGVTSGYTQKSRQWIDNANSTVQHYGWKFIYDGAVEGGTGLNDNHGFFSFVCTMYVQCKQVV